ncbi:HPr Serine kinase N terminus family protein, partial [Streptococcus pyogenes MGAS2111]
MTVTVKMLVQKVKLDVVYATDNLLSKEITTSDISRPGLEMTGYFDYYAPERLQLFGMKEWSYLTQMTSHNRYSVLKEMFKKDTPAVVVSRNLAITKKKWFKLTKEEGISLLRAVVSTSRLAGRNVLYFLT